MTFIIRVFEGYILLSIVCMFFTGGLTNSYGGFNIINFISSGPMAAAFLIFLAVVCTFGLGLFIVVPLLYGLGVIFHSLVIAPFIKKAATAEHTETIKITNDQLAIITYIRNAKAKGFTDEIIRENLKLNGWGDNAISDGFNRS